MTNKDITNNDTDSLDIQKLLSIAYALRYWVLLCVALGLGLATAYLRYAQPIYQSDAQIMLINGQGAGGKNDMQVMNSLLSGSGGSSTVNMGNEIFILKSTRLMKKVVEDLGLNTKYLAIGRLSDKDLYTETPVKLIFTPKEGYENTTLNIYISDITDNSIAINELIVEKTTTTLKRKQVTFNEAVELSIGSIMFTKNKSVPAASHDKILITHNSVNSSVSSFCKNLTIILAAKSSDVVNLTITDPNTARAQDILNTLIHLYNEESKEFNSLGITNTIDFLNERLTGLESELNIVESSANDYRTAHSLLDVGSQSQMIASSDIQYKDKLSLVGVQLSVIDIIKSYVDDMERGNYKLIPSNIGLEDANLNSVIDQYNKLVIERNRMLDGSSLNNPRVIAANNQISTIKDNIALSILNLEKAYKLQYQAVVKQVNSNDKQISRLPTRQLTLNKINRQQQIKEPLFMLLQQKREEAYIAIVAISDFARIIEPASTPPTPFSPITSYVYIIALFLSLVLPFGYAVAINVLRTKVMFDKDITDRTTMPILGNIPKNMEIKGDQSRLISESGRDFITESFRILRSKFDYLNIDKQSKGALIIQVTSSAPNEGKSFISTNTALTLAYAGKKVLIIGADLRKPTVGKCLDIKSTAGLSTFLSGKEPDIRNLIVRYEHKLDVIISGPIPPNPAELLSTPRLEAALTTLREDYDYIIIDSAPFFVVSDSMIISHLVDTVLYVVRAAVTNLTMIDALEKINQEKMFKSAFIILNAVDPKGHSYYGSGYGGYGSSYYAYGYGYSYGYEEEEEADAKPKKRRLSSKTSK